LYDCVHDLSQRTKRSLILTATPVQHRADEFLSLLKLMYPEQYDLIQNTDFEQMLNAQSTIRKTIAYLARALTPEKFDSEEFQDEITGILKILKHDKVLFALAGKVKTQSKDHGLEAAKETIQYISENYRIENRVIRNRRCNLSVQLPVRQVSQEYSYTPTDQESDTLLALHNYASQCFDRNRDSSQGTEYCRKMYQSFFSSPAAFMAMIQIRREAIEIKNFDSIKQFPDESELLEGLIRRVQQWEDETNKVLKNLPQRTAGPKQPHRLAQVIRAINQALTQPQTKVLIFSTWVQTLEVLQRYINISRGKQAVALFKSGLSAEQLQSEVDRFQSDDACRILLTDESGGEGRNFQMADQIIHVDLPWTPTQIEQRIGRVDRLGRTGVVLSIVPIAKGTLEEDLFNIWQQAFRLFDQSMSGMEIVLGEIQKQILKAFSQSPQNGLASDLMPKFCNE
jgi:ATP-dependent helicase HepA